MTTTTIQRKINQVQETSNPFLHKVLLRLFPHPIENKKEHELYLELISYLAVQLNDGKFQGREKIAVLKYINAVGHFIEEYEKAIYPMEDIPAEEILEFLMEQRHSTQVHIAEILKTSQPVVSEILQGKRKLTRNHIAKLSRSFRVSPAIFYDRAA